jgi:steroid delta-isomerase-like uncharacterized protein
MIETTADGERLVDDYLALWNGDFSKLDVVSESVVFREPIGRGEIRGRDGLEDHIREVRTGFPDLHVAVDDVLADEETIMVEWTMTGTHEGEYMDVAPTERELEITGMSKILTCDDRVHYEWQYFDRQLMSEQLGLADR